MYHSGERPPSAYTGSHMSVQRYDFQLSSIASSTLEVDIDATTTSSNPLAGVSNGKVSRPCVCVCVRAAAVLWHAVTILCSVTTTTTTSSNSNNNNNNNINNNAYTSALGH